MGIYTYYFLNYLYILIRTYTYLCISNNTTMFSTESLQGETPEFLFDAIDKEQQSFENSEKLEYSFDLTE